MPPNHNRHGPVPSRFRKSSRLRYRTGLGYDPDTPSNISGLAAWYDFSDASTLYTDTGLTTPVSADAQTIKGIADKSGNGVSLTGASSPLTYKLNIQNGKSATLSAGTASWPTGTLTQAQPFTGFIAARTVYSAGVVAEAILSDSSSGFTWQYRPELVAGQTVQRLAAGSALAGTFDYRNAWHISTAVVNGASSATYADGAADITGDPSTAAFGGTAGAFRPLNMYTGSYAGEVILYDGALSATDLNSIGDYLAAKWGLTWNAVS
jgi:hypothetical protein